MVRVEGPTRRGGAAEDVLGRYHRVDVMHQRRAKPGVPDRAEPIDHMERRDRSAALALFRSADERRRADADVADDRPALARDEAPRHPLAPVGIKIFPEQDLSRKRANLRRSAKAPGQEPAKFADLMRLERIKRSRDGWLPLRWTTRAGPWPRGKCPMRSAIRLLISAPLLVSFPGQLLGNASLCRVANGQDAYRIFINIKQNLMFIIVFPEE